MSPVVENLANVVLILGVSVLILGLFKIVFFRSLSFLRQQNTAGDGATHLHFLILTPA